MSIYTKRLLEPTNIGVEDEFPFQGDVQVSLFCLGVSIATMAMFVTLHYLE